MFLDDKLREQLPRQLQRVDILVMPYLAWERATVIFKAHGIEVDLKVDPETGLTDLQIAQLCATF